MSSLLKGNIHTVETFGTFDGPGVRYVLFMQGCPLQCKFCHNRDSWSRKTNTLMTIDDVLNDYKNYEAFYAHGGITASGGEPLLQAGFVAALFNAAKQEGIHTTLDTSAGCFNPENLSSVTKVLDNTDLVLLDIKHADDEAHKHLVGSSNKNIFKFLDLLESRGQHTIIRHVLIPTINDSIEHIAMLKATLSTYTCIEKIEVLPYHTHGARKWEELNLAYPLEGIPPMDVSRAKTVEEELNHVIMKRSKHPQSSKETRV